MSVNVPTPSEVLDREEYEQFERRKPPVIHKVMKEFAHLAVKPAMCGFIIRPTNHVSMPQAIVEQAKQCEACLTIMLEIDLAWSS